MDLDTVADQLYGLHPDEFVPARDDAVAAAREAGDRDLARAIGRLRRPTRPAWLANLLARQRGEQLEGLLALSGDLADAQRTLDGGALRALSAQRRRLVSAMAREGGRLAAQAGDSATEPVLRDLEGILDAALADPGVAAEVRSGRLTRTVSYTGFGPESAPGATPTPAGPAAPPPPATPAAPPTPPAADEERERRERAERDRRQREQDLADAERVEADARDRQEVADATRADAEAAHADARARVADLTAELETARERERAAAGAAREASAAARDAAREAGTAATGAARARARLAELSQ